MRILFQIGAVLLLITFFATSSLADDLIQGHYCYTYGDRESPQEAREITRSLAIRNSIESYRAFIASTSTIKNFQLTNDLVQMISSGYLKDIKVTEHKEEGRTICETIQAKVVSPEGINYSIEVNRGNWIRIKEEKLEHGTTFWDYDESSIKFISRDALTVRMKSTIKAGNIILLLKVTEIDLDCKNMIAATISEIEFDNLNHPVWKYVHYEDLLEFKSIPKGSVAGIFAKKFCPK